MHLYHFILVHVVSIVFLITIICAQRGEAARSVLKATRVCVDHSVTLQNLYTKT
jgi:hypothetical protein